MLRTTSRGVVVGTSIAWCAIWLPKAGTQYVSIDGAAARTLTSISGHIPSGAEVIASQGFAGKFAARPNIEVFGSPSSNVRGPEVFPVQSHNVWFVLSSDQGIEVPSTSETDQAIGSVAALPGVKLVDQANGVWAFRWNNPTATRSVALGEPDRSVPGWSTSGTSGTARLIGAPRSWTLASTGVPGYVASGDIWQLAAGRYVAHVVLSASAVSNVEVWDDGADGDTLLGRRQVVSKNRVTRVAVPFAVPTPPSPSSSTGTAPFAYRPEPPPRAARVEVRVRVPAHDAVSISRLVIQPARPASTS